MRAARVAGKKRGRGVGAAWERRGGVGGEGGAGGGRRAGGAGWGGGEGVVATAAVRAGLSWDNVHGEHFDSMKERSLRVKRKCCGCCLQKEGNRDGRHGTNVKIGPTCSFPWRLDD